METPANASVLLVRGGFVYTADESDQIYPNGSVLVVGDQIVAVGTVGAVDAAAEQLDGSLRECMQTINASGRMVLPGLVNAHWHEGFARRLLAASISPHDRDDAPGPFARGGDVKRLSVEFDQRYEIPLALEPNEAQAIAEYSLWTQLRCGTTTLGDVGSVNRPEALVAATRVIGIRAALSVWATDGCCLPNERGFQRTRDTDAVLARVEDLLLMCAADKSGRIRSMPSVIYPPNMSDELGIGLRELVDRFTTPFATHIGALANEAEVMRECFGTSSIRRFAALGLLTNRLLAVHCAFCDDEERRLLLDADVHINHSPAKYGTSGESALSGSRLIIELMRAGLDVSLSTDGLALPLGGMPEAMRQAWLSHNEVWSDNTTVRPTNALAMATRIAARGLGWSDEIGSIETGKQADLVMVRTDDWRFLFHPRPLEAFLTLGGSSDVDTVIVAGDVLLDQGRARRLDEEKLQERYVEAVTSFTSRHLGIDRASLAVDSAHRFLRCEQPES